MTRPPGLAFFLFWKPKKMVYKQQNALWRMGWGQDYKMQTTVYLRSQNIKAWMKKPLSAGCVNTVVISWVLLHLWQPSDDKLYPHVQYTLTGIYICTEHSRTDMCYMITTTHVPLRLVSGIGMSDESFGTTKWDLMWSLCRFQCRPSSSSTL